MGPRRGSLEGVGIALDTRWWSDRRVLVTGATGIIGSWLVKELLRREAKVVALVQEVDLRSEMYRGGDSEMVSSVSGNLEDLPVLERAIAEHGVDTVFHLGAQTIVGTAHRAPLPTFEANIRGTYNLLEACRVNSVARVVVASSDKAYGEQDELPYREDMPLSGRHPYEVSKSCADQISQAYHHTYGLPVAIARCGNVYGGGDLNWSRIVPATIRSLLMDQRPQIRSDGAYVRDYIYVKDVALAYIRLAEALSDPEVLGEGFNFGNERPVTVLELVERIQEVMDCSHLEPEVFGTAEGEIRSQYLSAAKARDVLDWRPQYDERTGLSETVQWYRDFLAA